LFSGISYIWSVTLRDSFGNQATQEGTYSY
jgi:hypothetical protein